MKFNPLADKLHEVANVIYNNTWQELFLFLIHQHKMKT